jgi:hypothetical protein
MEDIGIDEGNRADSNMSLTHCDGPRETPPTPMFCSCSLAFVH